MSRQPPRQVSGGVRRRRRLARTSCPLVSGTRYHPPARRTDMPYVALYPSFALFSVNRPVGLSGKAVNHLDDVRLVQWLLTQGSNTFYQFAGPPLQIDGYYGPATDYHLCRFGLALVKKFGDGRS